ncbi:MAG: polysaccharide deacetylase family protein [Verrucomicrobiae bacterium]|nr:polysaccharide deacetylase family protein [Verrucomicrobiae bacterium]
MNPSVPVGMYHHVNRNARDFITVHTDHFADQMATLAREGYTTLSAAELLGYMLGKQEVPAKSFVITFDDAWLDVYVHAFPILKRHGFKFTVFVVTDWTEAATHNAPAVLPSEFPPHAEAERLLAEGRAGEVICGWPHLREMIGSGLCGVEMHTASHREATRMLPEELREEIRRAREALRINLGIESRHLCWPKGRHDLQSSFIARSEGVQATYLVRRGVNLRGGGGFGIKRFTVGDFPGFWLMNQIRIFCRPLYGYLYSRLKPDRLKEKLMGRIRKIG